MIAEQHIPLGDVAQTHRFFYLGGLLLALVQSIYGDDKSRGAARRAWARVRNLATYLLGRGKQ